MSTQPLSPVSGRRCFVTLTAILVVFAACQAGAAIAETKLRWKFKQGDKFSYVMQQLVAVEETTNGRNLKTAFDVTLDAHWEIKSVDAAGLAVMGQTLDRIQFKMQGTLVEFDYDSKSPVRPEGPLGTSVGTVLDAMVGAGFVMKVNDRGEIRDFQMPEKLIKSLKASPATANLLPMFSADGLKQMLTESVLQLPDEALEKDHAWQRSSQSKAPPLTQKIENTYTYAGPETRDGRRLERISLAARIGIEAPPGAAIAVNITSQEAKGTILFDNAAGRLVEMTSDPRIEMELTIGGTKVQQKIGASSTMKWAAPRE